MSLIKHVCTKKIIIYSQFLFTIIRIRTTNPLNSDLLVANAKIIDCCDDLQSLAINNKIIQIFVLSELAALASAPGNLHCNLVVVVVGHVDGVDSRDALSDFVPFGYPTFSRHHHADHADEIRCWIDDFLAVRARLGM